MSHPQDSPQLGWLQVQILFLLWSIEMYGVEITRMLELRGVNVGTNQIYPALRRLEEKGALESRRVDRVGVSRIYYRTTEAGRRLAIHQYLDYGELIQEAAIDRLSFIPEGLLEMTEVREGSRLLDFSGRFYNLFVKRVAPMLGGGSYLVYVRSGEDAEVFTHRAAHYGLTNVRVVREREPERLDLPDGCVDLGLSYLNIRTRDRVWRLRELARVLKPNGSAVIVDWHSPAGNVRNEIMSSIFPGSIGVEPAEFSEWLAEVGLRTENVVEKRGLLYITARRA